MDTTQNTTPLIGMIGKKRSGKDTFASATGFLKISLADPLREAALGLDPLIYVTEFDGQEQGIRLSTIVNAIGWEDAKDSFPEVRRTLQRLGTESVRALDPTFWVRIATQRIEEARAAGIPVIVTDVRYPNEVQMILDLGGETVRITRMATDLVADTHPSETALDGYPTDYTFSNDMTQYDLEETGHDFADMLALRAVA